MTCRRGSPRSVGARVRPISATADACVLSEDLNLLTLTRVSARCALYSCRRPDSSREWRMLTPASEIVGRFGVMPLSNTTGCSEWARSVGEAGSSPCMCIGQIAFHCLYGICGYPQKYLTHRSKRIAGRAGAGRWVAECWRCKINSLRENRRLRAQVCSDGSLCSAAAAARVPLGRDVRAGRSSAI